LNETIIISIFFIWFAAFLTFGQNVASALFGAGLVGVLLWEGPHMFKGIIGPDVFYTVSTYSLSIIPLYLLMAQFLMRGKVVEDLFLVAHKLSGGSRFLLGSGTLVLGGVLGAVTGSGAAAAAALATLASPELEKYGYKKDFSIALTAVAGSLSAIIPPSIIMIIYGSLTNVPIGNLFMGAFIPGAITIAVFIICLYVYSEYSGKVLVQSDGAVEQETAATVETEIGAQSFYAFIFVIILMIAIFGGIYGGIVTAGEAGSLGAFVSLIGMLVMRRIGFEDIKASLTDAVKITAMIMVIVMGAQIFGRFLSFSMFPRHLLSFVEPLMGNPTLVLGIILFVFYLFGMFLESAAVMVLIIPVILPILKAMETDFLWFGVMASFVISIGLLTPPVGLSAYSAAAATNYPVERIFRYAIVFASVAAVVVVTLMIAFPGLITYLPSKIN